MSESAGTTLPDGVVFNGRRFKVRLQTLAKPLGGVSQYEIVETRAAAAVVPIVRQGAGNEPHVVLVEQERPAVGTRTLEIPAGIIDPRKATPGELETPDMTAVRELREETGYATAPEGLRHLSTIYT